MNYKLCQLYNKYTILSKYEQNNISFKYHSRVLATLQSNGKARKQEAI